MQIYFLKICSHARRKIKAGKFPTFCKKYSNFTVDDESCVWNALKTLLISSQFLAANRVHTLVLCMSNEVGFIAIHPLTATSEKIISFHFFSWFVEQEKC